VSYIIVQKFNNAWGILLLIFYFICGIYNEVEDKQ
jgi:cbb3-type cytochrome oxidase subunit 3